MGRSCFLIFLLISAVLSLCLPQGSARLIKIMRTDQWDDASSHKLLREEDDDVGKLRKMMEFANEIMDYEGPQANRNPRSGPQANSTLVPIHY